MQRDRGGPLRPGVALAPGSGSHLPWAVPGAPKSRAPLWLASRPASTRRLPPHLTQVKPVHREGPAQQPRESLLAASSPSSAPASPLPPAPRSPPLLLPGGASRSSPPLLPGGAPIREGAGHRGPTRGPQGLRREAQARLQGPLSAGQGRQGQLLSPLLRTVGLRTLGTLRASRRSSVAFRPDVVPDEAEVRV